jgi:hypothetical protein
MANWYYSIDGRQSGPVDATELKRLAASGTLGHQDKVRREDLAQWYPAAQIKGLFATQTPPLSPASLDSTANESTDTQTSHSNPSVAAGPAHNAATTGSPNAPTTQNNGSRPHSSKPRSIKRRTIVTALGVSALLIVALSNQRITPRVGGVSLAKGEFRTKIMDLLPRGCPGIARENDIIDAFGKPDRTQTLGNDMYWYWQCSDGTMQVVMSYLQNVELKTGRKVVYVSAINDY